MECTLGSYLKIHLAVCPLPHSLPEVTIQQPEADADPGASNAAFPRRPHPLCRGPHRQHGSAAGARGASQNTADPQQALDGPQHCDASQVRALDRRRCCDEG